MRYSNLINCVNSKHNIEYFSAGSTMMGRTKEYDPNTYHYKAKCITCDKIWTLSEKQLHISKNGEHDI